jgi:hypothetical protein
LPADEAGEFPVAVLGVPRAGDQGFEVALDTVDIALLEWVRPRPAGTYNEVATHYLFLQKGI